MNLRKLLVGVLLALVLPVALGVLVVKWRVAVTLDRWIEQARPIATVTRGGSFVRLNGEIGVENVSMTGVAQDIGTLRAERVTLHTPGLGWMLGTAVLGGDTFPERFGISVDGLDTTLLDIDESDPSVVGAASGALFDHAGCQDLPFNDADLEAMGLPRAAPRLFVRYEFGVDDVMRLETGVARDGASAFTLQMRVRVPGGRSGNAAALAGAAFENASLEVIDGGFVAARNASCPGRSGQDAEAFFATHQAMAQRMLRALGLAPNAAFWETYGDFARRGGRLLVNGMPSRPVPLAAMQGGAPLGVVVEWQVGHDEAAPRRVEFATVTPVPLRQGPRTLAEQIEAEAAAARAAASAILAPPQAEPAAAPVAAPVTAPVVAAQPAAALSGKPGEWIAIAYDDLRGREGAALRVTSVYGSRRNGTLANWNGAGMGLTLGAAEGGITLSMAPKDIRAIEIQVPPAPAGG
jgi:hypothetical protein